MFDLDLRPKDLRVDLDLHPKRLDLGLEPEDLRLDLDLHTKN